MLSRPSSRAPIWCGMKSRQAFAQIQSPNPKKASRWWSPRSKIIPSQQARQNSHSTSHSLSDERGPGWVKHKDTKGTKTQRRPHKTILDGGLLCVFVPFVSLCLTHPGPRSIHDFGRRLQRGRCLDAGRDFGKDSKLDINRPNDTANFRHTSG